jgi:hypothetical protein
MAITENCPKISDWNKYIGLEAIRKKKNLKRLFLDLPKIMKNTYLLCQNSQRNSQTHYLHYLV